MDSNTLMLMGKITLVNSKSGERRLVKVKGFNVLGFFFPQITLLMAGIWGKGILSICTFFFYPFWAIYIGINLNEFKVDALLNKGWVIDNGQDVRNIAHAPKQDQTAPQQKAS